MHSASPGNSATDIGVVTAICFGWFILLSIRAVASGFPTGSFSNAEFMELIAVEIIFASAAIGYLRIRGYRLWDLVPVPTAMGSLAGMGLYAASILLSWPLELAFRPAHSAQEPIELMVASATISFLPLVAMSVVNGLYEEVFLIGYLQRALQGSGAAFAIGVSLLVRVSYHLYQGPMGAILVLGFGLLASLYFLWKRKLWPVVFAHIIADIAGFSLL